MLQCYVYRLTSFLLFTFIISALPGCGEDVFTGGGPMPVEKISPNRIPDSTQVPDCASNIKFDTGSSNGFGLQRIINNAASPTDIAFIPSSSSAFVVTSQNGTLNYFNGSCDAINPIDLSNIENGGIGVVVGGEQGLLNIEFHPDYINNGYVFFYHTTNFNQSKLSNAISRMTMSFNTNGDMELSDPVIIIVLPKNSSSTNHNGGGLVFAPDDTLLASVGDVASNNSQLNSNLLGTVIRINPVLTLGKGGYTIPPGNMFSAGNMKCTGNVDNVVSCPEILATGLRNPFRMSIDGDIVYLGDVGSNNEEINSFKYNDNIAVNFGWPIHDGLVANSTLENYRNPIVYYDRNDTTANAFRNQDPDSVSSGLASIMLGDIYHGDKYANTLDNKLIFGDFYDGFMRAVGVDSIGNITDTDGVPGEHIKHEQYVSAIHEAPDGFIYITTYEKGGGAYRLVMP